MPKLNIITIAYNAQKTLKRAIDSIVKQTYTDWKYYIVDHGSTDSTRKIIQRYAKNDSRCIPILLDKNTGTNGLLALVVDKIKNSSGEWIAILDADDEYKPNAFETMLSWGNANELDYVVCGSEFVSVQTGKCIGKRSLPQNLIFEKNEDFNAYLLIYYGLMRTWWARIFKKELFETLDLSWINQDEHGDTHLSFELLWKSKKCGILSKTYHIYYLNNTGSEKSYFFRLNQSSEGKVDSSILAAPRIYDFVLSFLVAKVGYVSDRNADFLLLVYMNAIKDTLNVVLNADITIQEKLQVVIEIFAHEYTKRLDAKTNLGISVQNIASQIKLRNEIFTDIANVLIKYEEVPDELVESYCDALEFICAAIEHAEGWIFAKQLRVQFLTEQGRDDEAKPRIAELRELEIE
ncbi:glycosyltransferase [Lachnospiraceae bacterium ZAX-1]